MTAIWHNDSSGWRLLAPAGFGNEATLHDLIEGAPQLLPLAGAPQLTILGREVRLGQNYADLIAVEPSGRLAVIEIKLASNPESRRAIIAQVLTYAAYLHGMQVATLENEVLAMHLARRNWSSVADAVHDSQQIDGFDATGFNATLTESLTSGRLRLVFVLDDAPDELIRLVAYLEAVTAGLLIDLVTISSYQVGGSQILVPQRVEPERTVAPSRPAPQPPVTPPPPTTAEEFAAAIEQAPAASRDLSRRCLEWALRLDRDRLASLAFARDRRGPLILRVLIPTDGVGFVTLWSYGGVIACSGWRSVFERRAPTALERLDAAMAPDRLGVGNTIKLNVAILSVLTDAYREAASGKISLPPKSASEE